MIKQASVATLALFLTAVPPTLAAGNAQSLYVSLELALEQTTVGAIIQSISEQTGYEFAYDETLLNRKISKVSVNIKNASIEKILEAVFKNTGISYRVVNNRVFLKEDNRDGKESVRSTASIQQQKKVTVSGLVVDKDDLPVIGANIIVKDNPGVGTVTDVDGKFQLDGVSEGTVLVVSYIGYLDQEIQVKAGETL